MIIKNFNNCIKIFRSQSNIFKIKFYFPKDTKKQQKIDNSQLQQYNFLQLQQDKLQKIYQLDEEKLLNKQQPLTKRKLRKQDLNFKMFQMMIQQMRTQRRKVQQQKQKQAKIKDIQIKYLKYGLVATAAGLVVTIIGLIGYNIDLQPAIKQWWHRRQILQQYGQGQLDVPQQYLQNNSIQKTFKQILNSKIQLLHFVTGIGGTGKTTAMCYLVNKLRKQGKKIYYINLRVQDQQTNMIVQKVVDKLKDMQQLIKAVYYKQQTRNNATIIIDNIHLLEYHKQQTEITGLLALITSAPKSKTRIIAVSSSSQFYQKIHKYNFFDKASKDYVIQFLSKSQIQNLISKYCQAVKKQNIIIPKQVIQFVQGETSPRNVIRTLKQVKQIMIEQPEISSTDLLKRIKGVQQQHIQRHMIKIQLGLSKAKLLPERRDQRTQKQVAIAILQAILCLPTEMKTSDYSLVKRYIQAKLKYIGFYTTLKCVIDQYDKYNLLMFCHPRSRPVRKAFQRVLDKIR